MISVTIKYGLTKQVTREVADGTTVRQILQDASTKMILGFPEGVSAVSDGLTLSMDDVLSDGDTIILEKQAAAKA